MKTALEISECDWAGANIADVKAVLSGAADELTSAIGVIPEVPLYVSRWEKKYPQVDDDLDVAGRRVIHLSTGGWFWDQYIYQFSHELCHVLANSHEQRSNAHKWFEESLCELASHFVLRRMSNTWRAIPPYPNFREYAPRLLEYSTNQRHTGLEGLSLPEWLCNELASLEADRYQREKNGIVASHLLAFFEDDSTHWRSVQFMNRWQIGDDKDMQAFFRSWHSAAADACKRSISEIAEMLGFDVK